MPSFFSEYLRKRTFQDTQNRATAEYCLNQWMKNTLEQDRKWLRSILDKSILDKVK